mgnify:FL=1
MSVRALIFCHPNCVMTENRSYLFISSTCATQSSLARSAHPLKNLKFKLSFLIILFLPDENLIVGRDMFDPLFLDFRILLKPIIKACVIKEQSKAIVAILNLRNISLWLFLTLLYSLHTQTKVISKSLSGPDNLRWDLFICKSARLMGFLQGMQKEAATLKVLFWWQWLNTFQFDSKLKRIRLDDDFDIVPDYSHSICGLWIEVVARRTKCAS